VRVLKRAWGPSPADDLLRQGQGMLAEYERATLSARHRRGKRQAARAGPGHVLRGAPAGDPEVAQYPGGGQARYGRVPEAARLVRHGFDGGGRARLPIGAVCRRLPQAGAVPRPGQRGWDRRVGWGRRKHPASRGPAACGQTRQEPLRPRRRAQRGRARPPRRAGSPVDGPQDDWFSIPVPARVEPEVVAAGPDQWQDNRRPARPAPRGARSLLQGLGPCQQGGSADDGQRLRPRARTGKPRAYASSRGLGTEA